MNIRPERIHELAVEIGARRANTALDRTPDSVVYRLIEGLDDIAPMSDPDIRNLASRIAEIIRRGQAIVTFPQLLEGTGDDEPVQPETTA